MSQQRPQQQAQSPPHTLQGIRLAAGELTLRVAQERLRLAIGCQQGPMRQVRMKGAPGASHSSSLPLLRLPKVRAAAPRWMLGGHSFQTSQHSEPAGFPCCWAQPQPKKVRDTITVMPSQNPPP